MKFRTFPALFGAAALVFFPGAAFADNDSGLQRIEYDTQQAGVLMGEHTQLTVDIANKQILYRAYRPNEMVMPLRYALKDTDEAAIEKILGSDSARDAFIALDGTDLTKTHTDGGITHTVDIDFEKGSSNVSWGADFKSAYARSKKLAKLLDALQKRVSHTNTPDTPNPKPKSNPDHFDKISLNVTSGWGFSESISLDASTGVWSTSEYSKLNAMMPHVLTGKATKEQLDAVESAFAKVDAGDLDGKAISHMVADGNDFQIDAKSDGDSYKIQGFEEGLDKGYKTKVMRLINALEDFMPKIQPATAPTAAVDPNIVTNQPIKHGAQDLSGTVNVGRESGVSIDGLQVTNDAMASFLRDNAAGRYVTVHGVVSDDGIRVTSVQGNNFGGDDLKIMSSTGAKAKVVGLIPADASAAIVGSKGDKLKVKWGGNTGWVDASSLVVGGQFAPRDGGLPAPRTGMDSAVNGTNGH